MARPNVVFREDIPRKKEGGACPIAIQVYISRKRFYRSLGIAVLPSMWDRRKMRVKKKHPDSEDYNLIIDTALGAVNEVIKLYRLRREPLSIAQLETEYENPASKGDFLEFYENAMHEEFGMGNLAQSTFDRHQGILRKLRAFQLFIPFSEISPKLITKFDLWHIKWLKAEGYADGYGARENAKITIRKYMNMARREGKQFDYPFGGRVNMKRKKTEPVFLEEKEVRRLIDLYESDNELLTIVMRRVLRIFLVQCFCGLRYIDVFNLKKREIRDQHIVLKPQKTARTTGETVYLYISIPLRKLLTEGMQDKSELSSRNKPHLDQLSPYALPCYTEQLTNRSLKRIGRMARIDKKLTTHVARHTFATMFLDRGGSIEALKGQLGHKKIQTTMIYVHISKKRRSREVSSAFDNF